MEVYTSLPIHFRAFNPEFLSKAARITSFPCLFHSCFLLLIMAHMVGDKNGKQWFFKTEYMHILQEKKKLNSVYSEGYILLILRKECYK